MKLIHADNTSMTDKDLVKLVFCADCGIKRKGLECQLDAIHVTTKPAESHCDDRDSFYFTVHCNVNI